MSAQFASLAELETELNAMGDHSAEYWDKQVHKVEQSSVVDRNDFVTKLCTGKTVLNVGCTGKLDAALTKVATLCYGIDVEPLSRANFVRQNLDQEPVHKFENVELIVCGEVLEHLSNPGNFLDSLRSAYPTAPVVFTVPNALCEASVSWLKNRGRENVHKDHVCYYSVITLTTLLKRAGYTVTKHYWYNGKPYVAEGIIALARPQ